MPAASPLLYLLVPLGDLLARLLNKWDLLFGWLFDDYEWAVASERLQEGSGIGSMDQYARCRRIDLDTSYRRTL